MLWKYKRKTEDNEQRWKGWSYTNKQYKRFFYYIFYVNIIYKI